ncbi:MAG: phage tail tape measure protein [Chloroflexi bacterium]|nr:phage tail tape measure protein [Chloroflexota bacterium]
MQTAEKTASIAGSSIGSKLAGGMSVAAVAMGTFIGTEIPKMIDGIGRMIGSSAAWAEQLDSMGDVLGTTANESAAISVALKPFGSAAEDITTQMGKFAKGLIDVNGKMSPTAKFAKDLGIEFKDTNGKLLPTMDLLKNVSNRLSQMPEGLGKTGAMMTLFGRSGKDMSDALGAMANGGLDEAAKKAEAFGLAIGEDGAANAEAMRKSSADLDLAFQGLGVSVGNGLLPYLLPVVQWLSTMAVQVMPQLRGGIDQVVAVIAPFITLISSLASGLGAGGDPFGVITNGVYNFLTALGMGRGEAATWAVGIATFVTNAIALFQQLVGWVQANWPPFRDAIVGVFNSVVAWLQANWPAIQATVLGAFETIRSLMEPYLTAIWSIVTTIFGAIQGFLTQNGGQIQSDVGGVWEQIQGIISGVVALLQATVIPFWQGIATFISDNQETIKAVIELAWNAVKLTISTVLDVVKGIIDVALKLIKGDWKGAWDAVLEMLQNVWGDIQAFFGNIPTQLTAIGKSIIEGIVKGLNDAQSQVITTLQDIINGAIAVVKKMLGISSPSKVFAAIGENSGLAFVGSFATAMSALSGVGMPSLSLGVAAPALSYNSPQLAAAGASGPSSITIQNIMDGQVISENVYRRMGDVYYADRSGQWGGVH